MESRAFFPPTRLLTNNREIKMALVLVVEDALLSRRLICKALQSDGHVTIEATNGRMGLEMVANHAPDCILLDLLMPELDGLGVLKALREMGAKIPVIVVTADVQESSIQECLELGAIAVIHKLPKENELCNAVNKALAAESASPIARRNIIETDS
jgi:CheY-like chemotaxis protein